MLLENFDGESQHKGLISFHLVKYEADRQLVDWCQIEGVLKLYCKSLLLMSHHKDKALLATGGKQPGKTF